eukprot:Clim_evm58s157 gene=Clim_evmTU58s157
MENAWRNVKTLHRHSSFHQYIDYCSSNPTNHRKAKRSGSPIHIFIERVLRFHFTFQPYIHYYVGMHRVEYLLTLEEGEPTHAETEEFRDHYNQAVQDYISGKWQQARSALEALSNKYSTIDKAAHSILLFMAETEYKKPTAWDVYRALLEKYKSSSTTRTTLMTHFTVLV